MSAALPAQLAGGELAVAGIIMLLVRAIYSRPYPQERKSKKWY